MRRQEASISSTLGQGQARETWQKTRVKEGRTKHKIRMEGARGEVSTSTIREVWAVTTEAGRWRRKAWRGSSWFLRTDWRIGNVRLLLGHLVFLEQPDQHVLWLSPEIGT